MTRTVLYTAFALAAFAFNSILCRLALKGNEADATGFTLTRLASGAVMLALIALVVHRRQAVATIEKGGSWISGFLLFAYAICFSLAYLDLTAGTGALVLFGTVQMTMIAIAIYRGERPRILEWTGIALAVAGLIYLVSPGLAAPPVISSLLMAAAGISWGIYTLRGRGSSDPLSDTTGNFLRAVPFAVLALIPALYQLHLTHLGLLYAVLSGAVTSGIGYTIWYAALRHLTATRAAVLQLAVPIFAAVLAIFLLNELFTVRLGIAAILVLGGIGLTIVTRKPVGQ